MNIFQAGLWSVDPHSLFADPDPTVFLNADPDPDLGGKMNVDPDPDPQT